ncbi:MAG: 5-oxoprolinase subunit PxpA [Desulfobacteraceae bacterium]|nr:MAG: 5-oxoprolinase subunit PxpA [Desulfobacteraceae bacterium]
MALKNKIDLNADVGESFGAYTIGRDEELLPLISSANIACGFHAGDPGVMRRTLALAQKHGVAVGAHPGFPDLLGFGRRELAASHAEIRDYLVYQIGALQAFGRQVGLKLQHVKTHGALYNMAARDKKLFALIVETVASLDKNLILITLAGPERKKIETLAAAYGVRIAFEFFADRAYNPDGSLVTRQEAGAVLHDAEWVKQRVIQMAQTGRVCAKNGQEIELQAETICLHGDNPAAVNLAQQIRTGLSAAGIAIAPLESFV